MTANNVPKSTTATPVGTTGTTKDTADHAATGRPAATMLNVATSVVQNDAANHTSTNASTST